MKYKQSVYKAGCFFIWRDNMYSKHNNRYTDEELVKIIKDFYIKNNKIPSSDDFKTSQPNTTTFILRFGSWKNALKVAELDRQKYTKDKLRNELLNYYNEYGKVPTGRNIYKHGGATINTYIKHFGSFKNALLDVGLYELRDDKYQFCESYTDDQLLQNLKDYMKNKDKIPPYPIIKKELVAPRIATYEYRYGSIFNALKLIDYDIVLQKENELIELESDMIYQYKSLADELERTPSSRDINKYSKIGRVYSMGAYRFHFGSLYELQELCGLMPTVIGRNKSRDDLIKDIIWLAEELDRTPSQNDLIFYKNVASISKYLRIFGSWNKAVKESGLKPNGDIYYSNNGIECFSYYELLFTNMLESYKIKFTKENRYNEFINTNRKFRFDFVLNVNDIQYFIEIFGITCREDYRERINSKVSLCKQNNLKLIEIYPEDFIGNTSEAIYKMLLNKLQN